MTIIYSFIYSQHLYSGIYSQGANGTLTLLQPSGADSAHHGQGRIKDSPVETSLNIQSLIHIYYLLLN